MMKILDYSKVNGTQDRDDTMLVAKIVPYHSNASQSMKGPKSNSVVDEPNGEHFEARDIVVASPSALNTEEGSQFTENVMV